MSTEATEQPEQGIVFYSDGGCRPKSRGYGGYGLHGYLYKMEPPKKGIGIPGTVVTEEGYMSRSEMEEKQEVDVPEEFLDGEVTPAEYKKANSKPNLGKITPLQYFDGMGSLGTQADPVTNNYAELMGAMRALQEAAQYSVKKVLLFTDSEYVVQGLEKNAANWARDNWLKPDGEARPNADTWKELVACKEVLTQRGVSVKAKWVQGHNGDIGNERADAFATIGVMHSTAGETKETMERSPADGFWSYSATRHPLMFHRRVYFNTDPAYIKPGEYYLGDHGSDDESAGTRTSDGCYALVRLETPNQVIDAVRLYQAKVCGHQDNVAMIRVDNLMRPDYHRQVTNFGPFAMVKSRPHLMDLSCTDEEPLTKVFVPPRTATRIIDELSNLHEKLSWYLDKKEFITTTDLTPILYETAVKTSKSGETTTHQVLKDMYNVGYAKLRLDANYRSHDGTVKAVPVTLTLGIDMPDRNALKRLEEENPVVTLISWKEAATIFRYAVVIQCAGGMGIYAGVYSNIRIVPEDAPVGVAS